MFCTQCGKPVKDTMLFCPYCGSPIEPLDDPAAQTVAKPQPSGVENAFRRPAAEQAATQTVSPVQEAPSEPEKASFVTLEEMYPDTSRQSSARSLFDEQDVEPDVPAAEPRTVPHLEGHVPELNRKKGIQRNGKSNTFVPEKEESEDDLFLDERDFDKDDEVSFRREDYEYEEQPHGSFFMRHIRGIVSIALLAVLALIVVLWAFSSGGQRTMARIGLSGDAGTYARLGSEEYSGKNYANAAEWYVKALTKSEENADYAYSAAVCYYEAGNSGKAEEYFRKVIELRPDDANAYLFIRALYVNAQSLPEDVAALLRQGYEKTGNEQLKID